MRGLPKKAAASSDGGERARDPGDGKARTAQTIFSRKRVALIASTAALIALFVAAGGSLATATQGSAVIAGQANDETSATVVFQGGCGYNSTSGLAACGERGLQGNGTRIGVDGFSSSGTGVYGEGANGVSGKASSSTGAGVAAEGSGGGGTALSVTGRAKFSRSGITTISAGTASKTITLGVSTSSMVLATAQQNSKVFVKSAVPTAGSFTIRLSGNAPAGGLKVAWFVLN